MRRLIVTLFLVLQALTLVACERSATDEAPTQIMLRIVSTDQALRDELDELRVSVGLLDAERMPLVKSFPKSVLRWPVDLPITPRAPADIFRQFEVVVEARKGGRVLAQARVISGFAPDARRLLELPLFSCPAHDQGFVCGEPECSGTTCQVCTREGSCAMVSVIDPQDLAPFSGRPADQDSGVLVEASEAEAGVSMDAAAAGKDSAAETREAGGGADAKPAAMGDASAADAGSDGGQPSPFALAATGAPCVAAQEQTRACEGHASRTVLRCQQGRWQLLQTCAADQRCDSRVGTEQGTCAPIPEACVGKTEGDACDGVARLVCGVDLVTLTSRPCAAQMHCDPSGGVHCSCDTGYIDDGQGGCLNPDDCPASACAGGSCVDGLSDYSCNCNAGFAGTGSKSCTPVLYCPKDACTPGGTCVDTMNWSCQCASGFNGSGTQACSNINDCPADRCKAPAGSCQDGIDKYTCNCNPGFSGPDCRNDLCTPNPCKNGGSCSRTGALCVCPPGFQGSTCEIDVCNPNPCQHGSCVRTAQGASCNCGTSGFEGPLCEVDINDCAGTRCAPPNGTCVDGINGYSCQCNPGYSGADCLSDACNPNPCQQGAACTRVAGGASCACPLGYSGSFCETEITQCVANNACTSPDYPCTNTGTQGYTCAGQFAEWPMPDAMAGAKQAPNYDLTVAGVVADKVTGLIWQAAPDAGTFSWELAKSHCEELSWAGQSDWRMPTKIELESIIDNTRAQPAINLGAFPDTPATMFWTASNDLVNASNAWSVSFSTGMSKQYDRTTPAKVRCVRNNAVTRPRSPVTRYVVNMSADTVTDTRTGLIWQRVGVASSSTFTWDDAKLYCTGLGGGYRLPTHKELLTLVDPTRLGPAIDPKFPNTLHTSFWAATPLSFSVSTDAWVVSFYEGFATTATTGTWARRVRCVR